MKTLTWRARIVIWLVFLSIMYGSISEKDRDQDLRDNYHWCQMVERGAWYASEDEVAIRCAE